MSGTTTNFAWPYPTGGDVANVATDEQTSFSAIDSTLGNAWTAYSPAWTSAGTAPVLGNGTLVGRFKKFGKWGMFRLTLTAGTTTTFGTLAYRFSLPAGWTLLDTTSIDGSGAVYDLSATTAFNASIWPVTGTTVELRTSGAASAVTNLVPTTLTTGDIIQMLCTVELA